MIQRIQTIYLLIALAFGASMFFTNQIDFTTETTAFALNYKGINAVNSADTSANIPTLALTILLALTPLISITTILLYKKRLIQIRLCAANIGLLIGTTGLIYYFGSVAVKELHATIAYNVSMVYPIAGAILTFLALRGIGKDEALIRSMDRIR